MHGYKREIEAKKSDLLSQIVSLAIINVVVGKEIIMRDATFWAEQVREKNVSPVELLEETNRKIERLNPLYNAVVEHDLSQTLKQAKESAVQGPFAGVPIALKMLGQDKEGMGATAGSCLFKDVRSSQTDFFVERLEKNGFIPFGKTNAPEFGFKNVTDPKLYGVTKNVWHTDYHAGGSSGGAVSALASGMYPIVAASDGGGSIRIPASFSGVIGLKPTRGSMPTGPSGWRDWQGASINFALTVSMRDTETLFKSMEGNHVAAPYHAPLLNDKPVKKHLKIACCATSPIGNKVSDEAMEAFYKACDFLANQGHELVEIPYPVDGMMLIQSYYQMNGAETDNMMSQIEQGLGRELQVDDMEPMSWGIYQYGKKMKAKDYISALGKWDAAAYQMEQLFETFDLFLSPTATSIAPKLDTDLQSDAIRMRLSKAEFASLEELEQVVFDMFHDSLKITPYTQLANLTGQPSISLPIYVSPLGLPVGIQFMASKGREDLLFQVGREFEANDQFILPDYYRKESGTI